MSDQYTDLLQEAQTEQARQTALAQQLLGEQSVTAEQDAHQQTIDQQLRERPPTSVAELEAAERATEPGWAQAAGDFRDAVTNTLGNIPGEVWSGFSRAAGNIIGALPGTDSASWRQAGEDMTTAASSNTAPGRLVSGLSQFLLGFMPAATGARLLGAGAVLSSTAGSAVSGMADFSPQDPRLSDLVQSHPALANPVTAFLATQPGDTDAEGRLKNALEQATLGTAGDLLLNGVGSVLKAMRATKSVNDLAAAIEATPSTTVDMPAAATHGDQPSYVGEDIGGPATPHGDTTAAPQATAEPPQAAADAAHAGPADTAEPPQASPAEPQGTAADTAEPPAQPEAAVKPAEGEPVADGGVPAEPAAGPFDADSVVQGEATRLGMELPPEKQAELLAALKDGHYAEGAGMLDGTHANIDWDSLSDGSNMKDLFQAVEGTMGDLIRQAHGTGAVSEQTVVQLAQDIGARADNMGALQRLFESTTGEGGLAARITAGYGLMLGSARRLKVLAAAAHALNANTPEGAQAILAFQKQLSIHAAIVGNVRRSSAEIGRALWAHRSLKASAESALSNIADYAGTKLGPKALQDLAKSVAEDSSLKNLNNVTDAINGKGFFGVVKEIALNGMLSGPKTQVVNAVSVTGKLLMSIMERYVAAGIGTGQRLIMPGTEAAGFREAWAHTLGVGAGLRQAWKLAWASAKDEAAISPFSSPGTFAIQRGTAGRVGADLKLSQLINLAGQAIRIPARAMGIVDHFSQAVGYNADLGARAYVQAAKEADAQGLNGLDRDSFMANRVAEIKADPPSELHDKAMDAGRYNAFLENPQTDIGAGISKALNSSPILKLVIAPFTHRPGNLMRQALMDYSPLGLGIKSVRAALRSGTSDASVQAARLVIGTSTLLEGLHWASEGKITGGRLGSQNTEALDGIPTYSAKIGDRWYKFDRLDPVGMWLGAAADIHENWAHHYDPNDPNAMGATQEALATVVSTLGRVAMDKSFLKSVSDFTNAISAHTLPQSLTEGGKLVTENVAKLLPFSGLLNSVTQATDPTQRAGERGSILDGVIARIPGMSNELPPRRDLLGRPMPVISAWNPFGSVEASQDPMDQKLAALAVRVNAPPRTINGYALNADEYDKVVQLATQSPIFPGKQTLEQYLRSQTESDKWARNATAPDGGTLVNGRMTQQLIDKAYQYGREQYLVAHPDLIQQKRAQQRAKFEASRPQSFLSGVANEPKQAAAQP